MANAEGKPEFMVAQEGETSEDKIDRYRRGVQILNQKQRDGKAMTEEEIGWYDFVTFKLEDWASDADVPFCAASL